jgi:hypothetical protein
MASHKSVMHVQRGFRMSKSYAEQVMRDHCTITWVSKEDLTIRDTTLEERLAMREEQTKLEKLQEPLEFAEIHGLRFEPPVSGISATRREGQLLWAAHDFLKNACVAA